MRAPHRPPPHRLLRTCLALCCALAWGVAQADIFVIVNAGNPVQQLSKEEIADLYLGRTRSYPNGARAQIIDQADTRREREQFYRLLLNMPLVQVNAYWARLTFTGRQTPPEVRSDDQAVLSSVSRSVQAIGYVGSPPQYPGVRVIQYLHER